MEPAVKVVDGVEGSPCRLSTPGSSLAASWQVMCDDESAADAHFFSCRMVLCGEEGPVELVVPPVATAGEAPIQLPEVRQALAIEPGAHCAHCSICHPKNSPNKCRIRIITVTNRSRCVFLPPCSLIIAQKVGKSLKNVSSSAIRRTRDIHNSTITKIFPSTPQC